MSKQESPGGDRPLIALLTGPARLVCAKVIEPLRRRARSRGGTRELARLDERLLRDIGLTRSQVHQAAYGLLRQAKRSPAGSMRAQPSSEPGEVRCLKRRAIAPGVGEETSIPRAERAAKG